MDPALFEKMRPYVTLYSGLARPNPAYAGKPVLEALGLNEDQVAQMVGQREGGATGPAGPVAAQGSGTYSISSRATRPDGTRVQVQAAIRIGGGGGFGQLYLPLSWRVGETD
jgi:general secretion pathway protein K